MALYRVKKHMASKVAELQLGRKVIKQYVGSEGNDVVYALKSAARKHTSQNDAKAHTQTIYKMAMKAKMMDEERLVETESWTPLVECWDGLSSVLYDALNSEGKTPDLDNLSEKIQGLHTVLSSIMGPHMQDKNSALLKDSFEYFGSVSFLNRLIKDPEYEKERQILFEKFQILNSNVDEDIEGKEHVHSAPFFADKYSAVIKNVQVFWKKIQRNKDEIFPLAYDNFFGANPDYLQHFRGSREEVEDELAKLYNLIFTSGSQFERVRDDLAALGAQHVEQGKPYKIYGELWIALDKSIEQIFAKKYGRKMRQYLYIVFTHVADVMRSAYPAGTEDDRDARYTDLQEFWQRVEAEKEYVARTLYDHMFEIHPEYEELFPVELDLSIRDNALRTFSTLVEKSDDLDSLKEEMLEIGKSHVGLKVPVESYEHMYSALDLSLVLVFDQAYNVRIRATFHELYKWLQDIIISAY